MFKKLAVAALAAVTLGAPALASADTVVRYDHGRAVQVIRTPDRTPHFRPAPPRYQQWRTGQRFDHRYARNYRVIGNPYAYRLRQAPRGYRWVQSGRDAVLVAIASGLIGGIIANQF
jgi:Ni/Co efflux regulator RcnB